MKTPRKLKPDSAPFLCLSRHRRLDEYDQGSWPEVIFGSFALVVLVVIVAVFLFAL